MSAGTTGTKRRWLVAAVGAAIVMGGSLLLFRAPGAGSEAGRPPAHGRPAINLAPARSDELAMRDLAPLFLPTRYNAAPAAANPPQPGSQYFDRDPGIHRFFDPDTPSLGLPGPVQPPANAIAALADPPAPLAEGFGRTDASIPPRPPTGGHVDIYASDARDSLLGLALPPDAAAPLAGRETLGWKPLEFAAAVDPAGLVGPLILTSGSGVEEVDDHFRNYLAREFHIGDRLPPGFYRIVVGP